MKSKRAKKSYRWLIISLTSIFALVIILVTGFFGVGSPNDFTKSKEYGQNVQFVVGLSSPNVNEPITKDEAQKAADGIYQRLDPLESQNPPKVEVEKVDNSNVPPPVSPDQPNYTYRIRVTVPNVTPNDQPISGRMTIDQASDLIASQSVLSFYTLNDAPIFTSGGYNSAASTSGPTQAPPDIDQRWLVKPNSASAKALQQTDSNKNWAVSMNFASTFAQQSFTTAISSMSSATFGSSFVVWLDHDKLFKKAQLNDPAGLAKDSNNLYNYMHVTGPDGKKTSILKENQYNASNYLIATYSPTTPTDSTFTINGNFTREQATSVASRINFGLTSDYKLNLVSYNWTNPSLGMSAFDKSLIAAGVVCALLAVFMIINYGLLGVISTIAMALYITISLLMFTVMRGEYSPETIAALMVGLGIAIDANIITFERLKDEIYKGFSVSKSTSKVNRVSLPTIFDANIALLVTSFSLFYFGAQLVRSYSVMMILTIVVALVILMAFTKVLSTVLIHTGAFENRRKWLGVYFEKKIPKDYQQPIKAKYQTLDYVKQSKWCSIGSLSLISLGLVIFSVFAGIAGSFGGGFAQSGDFKNKGQYIVSTPNKREISSYEASEVSNFFQSHGVSSDEITYIYSLDQYSNPSNPIPHIGIESVVVTNNDGQFDGYLANWQNVTKFIDGTLNNNVIGQYNKISVEQTTLNNALASELVKGAIIAIAVAMLFMVLYVLIRFQWTYGFAIIIALVHDGLIITALFVIARIHMDTVFVAGLLAALTYSINDKMAVFDRVRERMKIRKLNEVYTAAMLKTAANDALGETAKRSFLNMVVMIIIGVCFLAVWGSVPLTLSIALLSGAIVGTYSSFFVSVFLWMKFEIYRQKRIEKRKKTDFWKTRGIEEQTIESINEFSI